MLQTSIKENSSNISHQHVNDEKLKTPSNKTSSTKNDSPFSTPLINELSEKEAKIKLKEAYKELNECSKNLKLAAEIGNQLLNEKIKIENLYKNALEKINELKEYGLTKENVDISREKEESNSQQLSQLLKSNATQDDLKTVIKELDLMNAKNYKIIEKLKEENKIYQIQIENNKSFYEEEINKYRNDWQILSQKYKQLYNMRIDEITEITKELNIDNKNNDLIQKLKERSIINFGESILGNQSQSLNEENRTLTSHEYQQQIEKLKTKNKKLQSELKAAQLIRQTDNEKIELLKQKIQKYKTIISDLQLKNDRYSHEMKSIIHKFEPNIQLNNIKKEKKEEEEESNVNKKPDIKGKGNNMEITEENIDADTTLEIFKDVEKTILQNIINFNRNKNNKEEKEVQTDPMNINMESSKSSSSKLVSVETQTVVTLPEKIITPFSALYKRNKESNNESDKEKELSQFINIVKENNTLLPLNYYNKDKNLINIPLYHDENEKNYLNRPSIRNINISIIDKLNNDGITENENLKNIGNNDEETQNFSKNKENQKPKPNNTVENLAIDKEVPMETDDINIESNQLIKTTVDELNNNSNENKEIKEKTLDNIINAYIEGKEDKKMDIDNNDNSNENEMEKITIENVDTEKENSDNDQINKIIKNKNNDSESNNINIVSSKENKILENDSSNNINNIISIKDSSNTSNTKDRSNNNESNSNTNNTKDSSNNNESDSNTNNTVDRDSNFNKYRYMNSNMKMLITDSNYNHTRHDRKRSSDTYLMKSYIPLYKKPRFSLNEYSRGFYNPIDMTEKEIKNDHSEHLTFHENLSNNKTGNFEETINNNDEKK